MVFKAILDSRVTLVLKETKAIKVFRALSVSKDSRVLVPRVRRVSREIQVSKVTRVFRVLAFRVSKVMLGTRVVKET
jgi:hypothetical protein